MNTKAILTLALCAAAMSGCGQLPPPPPTSVHQPISVRPAAPAPVARTEGSIFAGGMASGLLFEDRRARNVGDVITVQIVEKTDASKKSNTNTSHASNNNFAVNALSGLPGKGLLGSTLGATSNFSLDGKGESNNANDFSGIITVTVTEVLSNGNLLVSGEK